MKKSQVKKEFRKAARGLTEEFNAYFASSKMRPKLMRQLIRAIVEVPDMRRRFMHAFAEAASIQSDTFFDKNEAPAGSPIAVLLAFGAPRGNAALQINELEVEEEIADILGDGSIDVYVDIVHPRADSKREAVKDEDPRDGSGVVDDNPQTEPDPTTWNPQKEPVNIE